MVDNDIFVDNEISFGDFVKFGICRLHLSNMSIKIEFAYICIHGYHVIREKTKASAHDQFSFGARSALRSSRGVEDRDGQR